MDVERCIAWEPVVGISTPCADITIHYTPSHTVDVTMHFARVVGNPAADLHLQFTNPIAMYWEEETYGIKELPTPFPRCAAPKWANWTFPLLIVEHSKWLRTYEDRNDQHGASQHFALISMNDLVHILAAPEVVVAWQTALDA